MAREVVEEIEAAGFCAETGEGVIYVRRTPRGFPVRVYRKGDGYSELAVKRALTAMRQR